MNLRGRWVLFIAVGVLLLALALRVVHIGWSYSNNGVDEGVMIERTLMVSRGFSLYSELPCDQAPAAFIIGSVFSGDVVSLRLLTALVALGAVACCMAASRRMAGPHAMLITGVLLALDFTFVRESRLFSLDALAASLLAVSIAAFMMSRGRGCPAWLVMSGLLVGLAASVKLIGGLGLAGMLAFVAIEAIAGREKRRTAALNGLVLSAASAAPLLAFMVVLGPSEMVQGVLFDQTHREFDAYLKLSVLAFFGLCAAYTLPLVYARRMWRTGPDARLLLCVAVVLMLFMVFQPLTFLHHMVFLSPVMALLAGAFMASEMGLGKGSIARHPEVFEHKTARLGAACKAALMASVLVSGGLSVYGVVAQGEPAQVEYGRILSQMTSPDDYVICGDPIIAAYADLRIPPEVVNAAERRYPLLDIDILRQSIIEYDVAVVVVCYYLNDITGLEGMLAGEGFSPAPVAHSVAEDKAVLDLFQEPIEPVTFYVRQAALA